MSELHDKIAKMLDLAENAGATEAEADTAMKMATALMAKYGIENPRIQGSEVEIMYTCRTFHSWHIKLASCVAHISACKMFFIHGDRFHPTSYSIVGRQENREAAIKLFVYLHRQIEIWYKSYLQPGLTQSARAEFRRTFKYAAAMRLLGRGIDYVTSLKGDQSQVATGHTALVVTNYFSEELYEAEKFLETQGIKLTSRKVRSRHGSGTLEGHEAGGRISLTEQIE